MSSSISTISPAAYVPPPKPDASDTGSQHSLGNDTPTVTTNTDSTTTTTVTDPNGTVVSATTSGTPSTGQTPGNGSSSSSLLDITV